eukprot:3282173-Rhodomonas_salina.1
MSASSYNTSSRTYDTSRRLRYRSAGPLPLVSDGSDCTCCNFIMSVKHQLSAEGPRDPAYTDDADGEETEDEDKDRNKDAESDRMDTEDDVLFDTAASNFSKARELEGILVPGTTPAIKTVPADVEKDRMILEEAKPTETAPGEGDWMEEDKRGLPVDVPIKHGEDGCMAGWPHGGADDAGVMSKVKRAEAGTEAETEADTSPPPLVKSELESTEEKESFPVLERNAPARRGADSAPVLNVAEGVEPERERKRTREGESLSVIRVAGGWDEVAPTALA